MRNGIKITAFDHLVLNVSDVDRALQFYTEVLGLRGERVEEFKAGKVGFPSVRIDSHTIIDLFPRGRGGASPSPPVKSIGNLDHFCLVIAADEFTDLIEHLNKHRVAVHHGPVSRWGARGQATSIYCLDPDGNEVELRCYGR